MLYISRKTGSHTILIAIIAFVLMNFVLAADPIPFHDSQALYSQSDDKTTSMVGYYTVACFFYMSPFLLLALVFLLVWSCVGPYCYYTRIQPNQYMINTQPHDQSRITVEHVQFEINAPLYDTNTSMSEEDLDLFRNASTIKLSKDPRTYLPLILLFVVLMLGLSFSQFLSIKFYKNPNCSGDSSLCAPGVSGLMTVFGLILTCGIALFHISDTIHIRCTYPLRSQPKYSQLASTAFQTVAYCIGAALMLILLIVWGISQIELGEQYSVGGHTHRKVAIFLDVLAGLGMVCYMVFCGWSIKVSSVHH